MLIRAIALILIKLLPFFSHAQHTLKDLALRIQLLFENSGTCLTLYLLSYTIRGVQ